MSIFKNSSQQFLVLLISLGLVLLSPGAQQFVIAQTQLDEYELALENLDKFMRLLQELRDEIDRTQFELEALSFELAFEEPETIVNWVRENIYFEQYPGLLRGAQGTLMSRAGNALDQAVLLATLLRDAGYEVQIKQGQLSEAQAKDLLANMASSNQIETPIGDLEQIEKILTQIAELGAVPEQNIEQAIEELGGKSFSNELNPLTEKAKSESQILLQILDDANVELSDSLEQGFVVEAQDYFWLEYRLDPSEDWQEVHSAFKEGTPKNLEATNTFTETIPETLQHRLRFQVLIEQKQGDELIVESLTPAWEKPIANLNGVALTYSNVANTLQNVSSTEGLMNALEETSYFLPMLNGELFEGTHLFDSKGRLLDSAIAAENVGGVAELFQTLGDTFGDAFSALNFLGEPGEEQNEEALTLTGQWLEYTLITPNGQEKTYRRTVLDRIGNTQRALGNSTITDELSDFEVTQVLSQHYTFMIAAGKYNDNYVLDRVLERFINYKPILVGLMAKAHKQEVVFQDDMQNVDRAWLGHLQLYQAFDAGSLSTNTYRAEPSLISFKQGLVDPSNIQLDVINNARRSFTMNNTESLVETGVWESYVESQAIALSDVISTTTVFEQARAENIPLKTILPNNIEVLSNLALSEDTKYYIKQDLNEGFVVIVPETMPEGSLAGAWWRINPETGETLGMLDGLGGAFTEYAALWKATAAVLLGLITFVHCEGLAASLGKAQSKLMTCIGLSVTVTLAPYSVALGLIAAFIIAIIDIAN